MNLNLEIKDQVELDDNNTYVVASKVKYNNLFYYYLVDINNNSNLKFCYEDPKEHDLIDVVDQDLIKTLLPKFLLASKDIIMDLIKSIKSE